MIKTNDSLQLFKNHKILFSNNEKGLVPLIEVYSFLTRYIQNKENLIIYDKVIGRASALILNKIGIKTIKTNLITEHALTYLESKGFQVESKKIIDKINSKIDIQLELYTDEEEALKYLMNNYF